MGAGGSTAASCSSLDLTTNQQQHRHQHHLHEQRMLKYRKQQQAKILPPIPKSAKNLLKHSSSNFDLTQNHLIHQHYNQPLNEGQQNMNKLSAAWLGEPSQQTAAASYSSSNANYGADKPMMFLPNNKPVSSAHILSGAKRSNAGVASRIHQQNQRQLNRGNELRKFSDSLPSLNNLLDHNNYQQNNSNHNDLISPVSSYAHSPPTRSAYCRQKDRLLSHKSAKCNQKQQLIMQCHSGSRNSNHPNTDLVNRYDESSYQRWSSANSGEHQHLMKRAISLSSLHSSHNNNNNHHHNQQHHQNKQQQRFANVDNCVGSHCNKQLVSNCNATQSHIRNNDRNEPSNNNLTCDIQQSNNNLHPTTTGYMKQQQQHLQYNQATPVAKKILKFKQLANNGLSSRRYKQKQKIQQQQQQGCPVLPPLPRSQSLHELIQLRATENGQRMRTTGTLRGPLGTGEASSTKVNLVVELLENRRQQKMNEQQQEQQQQQVLNRDSTETMLSQASSEDDGIHDVSISVDQSTGDSRHKFSLASNKKASNEDKYNSNHRLSVASQEGAERGGRQRVFNKNNQTSNFSQKRFTSSQNQQQYERPQSQRVDVNYVENFNHHQVGKSTLKRSVSHSALQNSLNNLDSNNDEDESDDLNELAKFLYQFKQRQANKTSPSAKTSKRSSNEAGVNLPSSSNQQQSPNSTTSSSGFASSTCTSNSISSTASHDESLRHKIDPKRAKAKISDCAQVNKQAGRKKYPAPPRPDERVQDKEQQQIAGSSNKNNKNLISGQLKLSSSLLSIVDEYNSTLQNKDKVSPTTTNLMNSSSNLASVLLGDSEVNKMQMDKKLSPEARLVDNKDCGANSPSVASSSSTSNSTTAHCHRQHQLEQLRRYTQLRQMSQSELALNHLTSSGGRSPKTQVLLVKGKRDQDSEQRKPYKSKLINIIRRISDKSEITDGRNSGRSSSGRAIVASGGGGCPGITVGGNQTAGEAHLDGVDLREGTAINQSSEMMAPSYSNQCRQQKYNHAKFSKAPNGKSCLSESLCDLNFDCDFELIKNCGSTSGRHRGATEASAATGIPGSSLLAGDPGYLEGGGERRCQKEIGKKHQHQHHQQIINPSKGENNWRLAPTASLSLDKPATCFGSGKEFQHQRLPSRQSMEEPEKGGRGFKCKLHAPTTSTTDKLANQTKLKWSASGWLMNSSSSSGSNAGRNSGCDRTKGLQKQQQQQSKGESGKSCLSKLISNSSMTPLSVVGAAASNNGALTCNDGDDESLIESKNFAKVNSEAKQLLNELDHSLDMVSGRYPFSRKAALAWWKMGDDLVSASNANASDQLMVRGGRLVHRYEFPSSSSDSEYDFRDDDGNDDDDDDDYASINRAMINATFDVDVNQTKQSAATTINENLNSLSIEPGSPSDSFTFGSSNSPEVVVSPSNTTTTKLQLLSEDGGPLELLKQSKGENHMSKQQSMGQQAYKSAVKQQSHPQIRNYSQFGSGSNHASSTSQHGITSQGGGSGISDPSSHHGNSNSAEAARRSKLADNGIASNGSGNKRIVSYGERMIDKDGGGGGKVELNRKDGEIRGKRIGLAPMATVAVANNRIHDRIAGKLTSGKGIVENQDLCAHEAYEVSAKTQPHCLTVNDLNAASNNNDDNHDGHCELNITRCLMGGSHFRADSNLIPKTTNGLAKLNDNHNDDHDEDIADNNSPHCWLNGSNKSNRLLSKCQSNGSCGKNFLITGHDQDCPWTHRAFSSSSGCRVCGTSDVSTMVHTDGARSSCNREGGTGAKSNGLSNGSPPQKLDLSTAAATDEQNAACHRPQIQGRGLKSGGPCQLSSGWCCCLSSTCDTTNATVRDNENTEAVNGQKQALECDRQSSPREQQKLNGANNGRQMVAVENKPFEMRSSNFSGKASYNKEAKCNKCCSSALGSGCENIFGKLSRDLHSNGVTFSKTTAPTSEELKNKLITQEKLLGTCHCSSVVSITTTEVTTATSNNPTAATSKIAKASAEKLVTAGDGYQSAMKQHALVVEPNSELVEASEESCFCYCEMGEKNFLWPNDKTKLSVVDKTVGPKEQEYLVSPCASHASCATDRPPNSDNCRQNGADDSRCKVASCHHPSSKLNGSGQKTNYNEDVKLQPSVSRDNLILETAKGYKLEGVGSSVGHQPSLCLKKSAAVSEVVASPQSTNCSHRIPNGCNCRCCRLPVFEKQLLQKNPELDQETPNGRLVKRFGVGLGGKLSVPVTTYANNGDGLHCNLSSKSSPSGRPLCSAGGATRLIAKSRLSSGKPICRSNSELVPALDKEGNINSIRQSPCSVQNPQPKPQKESTQRLLFGKLRNSLLNQTTQQLAEENALSKSSKLTCSQVSLVNYYNGSSHFVSPFIAPHQEERHSEKYHHHHHDSATALNDQMNVDENFILKRKTPNAGLKSRC